MCQGKRAILFLLLLHSSMRKTLLMAYLPVGLVDYSIATLETNFVRNYQNFLISKSFIEGRGFFEVGFLERLQPNSKSPEGQ